MYEENFVTVIKCNGRTLREKHGVVFIPFGSEYSLLLNNLNNKRALVKIEIDGRKITGGGLIIPHSIDNIVELERFIDTDDMDRGYKFKFIKKTKDIQDHRGDTANDGIIKIEWWFEETYPSVYGYNIREKPLHWSCNSPSSIGLDVMTTCSVGLARNIDTCQSVDDGITVEGSDSCQEFVYEKIGKLESKSHVMIFQLKGLTEENKLLNNPIYSDCKIECKQCGKKWKSSFKFCGNCGSRLIL